MNKTEAQDMFRDMSQDCKSNEGASGDDVEEMVTGNLPSTKPGQCLMACMLDQFGIVRPPNSKYYGNSKLKDVSDNSRKREGSSF